MKDPREILENELIKIGVKRYEASLISLDAGSSQCVVNKKYLNEMNIEKYVLELVYQKVVDFYTGKLFEIEE